MTHSNYPMFIVFLGAHSWCCTFYEFCQVYSDKHLSLEHHAVSLHCFKHPLYSAYSLICPSSWQPLIFFHLLSFAFSGMSYSWNHRVWSVLRFASFLSYVFKVPPYLFWASLVAQLVKNPPAMWETWVQSLSWEDFPGGKYGNPLQYSCLENPHGQRSLADYSHGVSKSRLDS